MRHNPDYGIMSNLMQGSRIEMSGVFESLEPRQADHVVAWPVVGFSEALPDGGAAAGQELVNGGVAVVRVAGFHLTKPHDP
jgi:hypothetical protein